MIRCDFCGQVGTHDYRCPNYIPPKAKHYCCYCSEGIYQGIFEGIYNYDFKFVDNNSVTYGTNWSEENTSGLVRLQG